MVPVVTVKKALRGISTISYSNNPQSYGIYVWVDFESEAGVKV
jgi:hypothetical protein